MGASPACWIRLKNIPLGSMSFVSGFLQLKRARREHRIYSLAITRVSAASGGAAGVNCDHGQHAATKVGPREGVTPRRAGLAIINSWDGGCESVKQSTLSGLVVTPARLPLTSEQHIWEAGVMSWRLCSCHMWFLCMFLQSSRHCGGKLGFASGNTTVWLDPSKYFSWVILWICSFDRLSYLRKCKPYFLSAGVSVEHFSPGWL